MFSSLKNLKNCISVVNKLNAPIAQLDSDYLQYITKKLEWDVITELILDLSYSNELGFLSPKENELHEKLASAFVEVLLPTNENHPLECANLNLDPSQTLLFHSRIEDKLVEKLQRFQKDDSKKEILNKIRSQRNAFIMELVHLQCDFAETISRICTVTSEIFREVRRNAQTKTNLFYSAVLLTQAEGLRSQVSSLNHSIMEEARKNKGVVNYLQQTRAHLSKASADLKNEVDELERILRVYQNQDDKYHELVRRYGECQRQLALRTDLLNDAQSVLDTNRSRLQGRRSLSLGNLPKIENTFDHSLQ